jgi:hypothetical protein
MSKTGSGLKKLALLKSAQFARAAEICLTAALLTGAAGVSL